MGPFASDNEAAVTFTFSIDLAAVIAAVVGFLHSLVPTMWAPFYEAAHANRDGKVAAGAALVVGRMGQAVATAVVGLLVAIFALGIVGVADARIQPWTGALVLVLSTVYFLRYLRQKPTDWSTLQALVGEQARRRPTGSRSGQDVETPWHLMRSAITSPAFLVSPMFVAAAGSGTPDVWNGIPIVLAYLAGTAIGVGYTISEVARGSIGRLVVIAEERLNLIVGVLVALLGIATALL